MLLGVTLVVGISLAAMLVAGRQVLTRSSLGRAGEDLLAARIAFNRLVDNRVQSAAQQTRLVAELPTVRSLLRDAAARGDRATVDQTATDYCGKLQADFCIVSDPLGVWLGSHNYPAREPSPEVQSAIDAARLGRSGTSLVTLSNGLFLVVAEAAPFDDQETLGAFAVGYRLDDTVAAELASVAHCDVSFVCGDGRLCATSLPAASRVALARIVHENPGALGTPDAPPALRAIGPTSYVGAVYPLSVAGGTTPGSGGAPRLVLLQDWTATERAAAEIQTALLRVGLATFLVALGGGLVFSRRLTRPLRDLADVADEIAGGNWARRVPLKGPTEARTMAEAFNRMTFTLTHWHREARTRADQLQESYDRFRAVTDSANDAIASVNRRGEIVFWNLRAQQVFGYSESEALGQPLTLLMPERYRFDYAEEMARLLSGESRWVGRSVELAGLRRDGTEVPVELSLSTWTAGQEMFYTAVIRDITERKQAAETLRQREEQLRQAQKMEAVGRLAGGIAHDFNNLLTAILGYADLLIRDLPADSRPRKDAEEIQKAGRSAADMIRELLAFGRKQVLQPVVLDLKAVTEGTQNLLRRLLGAQVELVVESTAEPDCVRADRTQLEQVLVNLAVNARDAMPRGGRLTIRTSVVALDGVVAEPGLPPLNGRYAVLTVSDTGEGMSEETRARIFEPFFTTKPVGKGTGLGLATVYGIVKQSGGHIWVESERGKGTSFNVALPVIDAEAAPESDDHRARPVARGSELLLLVEDNDSVRSLAREALLRNGYRVIEARNGREALEVGAAHIQDLALLVTDVVMPVMGGRELAAQLTKWRPDLKIIFTSGYVDERATRGDTGDWGAMFLQKPFTSVTLGRAVRDVLDARG